MKSGFDSETQTSEKALSYKALLMIGFSVTFIFFVISYGLIFSPFGDPHGIVELPTEEIALGSVVADKYLSLGIDGSENAEFVFIDAAVSNQLRAQFSTGNPELDGGLRLELKLAEGINISSVSCSFDNAKIILSAEMLTITIDKENIFRNMRIDVLLKFKLDVELSEEAAFECKLYDDGNGSILLEDKLTIKGR